MKQNDLIYEKHIHDIIVEELFELHSIASLMWLIDRGREVDLQYNGKEGFISKSGSSKTVSLWLDGTEQAFESTEQLMDYATVGGDHLKSIWKCVRLVNLW